MNTVFFRVDASTTIGEGHLRRCLTIAKTLTFNVNVVFLCRSLTPATKALLAGNNLKVIFLDEDEQLQKELIINLINSSRYKSIMVIDHYLIDSTWEYEIKLATNIYITVIDDLANRDHFCDLIIDANYFRKPEEYQKLVNNECEILCGIDYIIFSDQVLQSKRNLKRAKVIKNESTTHVFFGATDPHTNSSSVASVINKIYKGEVHVAFTKSTSHLSYQKKQLANISNVKISDDELTFSHVMSKCEFAIGAPGITLWERLMFGCKTACFATSENQITILQQLHNEGVCYYLGSIWTMSPNEILSAITKFYDYGAHKLDINSIEKKFSGQGCQLIIDKILKPFKQLNLMRLKDVSLKPYTEDHIEKTVKWLSSSTLRTTFGFSKKITINSHTQWLRLQTDFYLWAIYLNNEYTGNISIRINPETNTGYLEVYLGDDNSRGKGIGKSALELIRNWSFSTMKLKQIELITIAGNIIAEKLYKNSGFFLAGVKENSQKIDGKYANHHQWLLVNESNTARKIK